MLNFICKPSLKGDGGGSAPLAQLGVGRHYGGALGDGDGHATVCEGPVEHAPAGEKDREGERESERERGRDLYVLRQCVCVCVIE